MPGIHKYFSTNWVRYRAKPADITSKVEAYFKLSPPKPESKRFTEACQRARLAFRLPGKVRPYHINDSIRYYQHPERSPGLPHTRLGYHRKDEVHRNKYKQYVHNLKYGIISHCAIPCTAAAKSMVAPESKFRLIWVYPAYMTLAEGMFAQPLISHYQGFRGQYAIWVKYSRPQVGMPYLMSQRGRHHLWLGLDWSSFDVNVPPWLIRIAFGILRENLDFSGYDTWGAPSDPMSLPRLWKAIVRYFIDTPIRLPSGQVKVKHQGVPSGSFFTSMIDSVCNCIMVNYLLGDRYQRSATWYLGDDCLTAIPGVIDVRRLAEIALVVFGAVLNPAKTELGKYVSFLGYRMGTDLRPQANFEKLSAQVLLPDRPDKCLEDTVTRILALQLSCFGRNLEFMSRSQAFLMDNGVSGISRRLNHRDELVKHLGALGIEWEPVADLLLRM